MEIDYREWIRIITYDRVKELEIQALMQQGKEPILLTEDGKAIQKIEFDSVVKSYKFITVK